jgi:hypothetical protein
LALNHKTGEEGIPLWLNWRLTCLVVDAGMSALPPKAYAQRRYRCLLSAIIGHAWPGELFLVVADTANLISNLRV